MRPRKTKLISIDISSNIFSSFETAVKEANALKQYISRYSIRKGYSICAIIGISKNNRRTGKMIKVHTGRRGRPFKFFKLNPGQQPVNPHIHIILFCNPADTICEVIRSYMFKKHDQNCCWKLDCGKYTVRKIRYVIMQSTAIRTLLQNNTDLLNIPYFQSLINRAYKGLDIDRITFTNENAVKPVSNPSLNNKYIHYYIPKLLECNRPIPLVHRSITTQQRYTYLFHYNIFKRFEPP